MEEEEEEEEEGLFKWRKSRGSFGFVYYDACTYANAHAHVHICDSLSRSEAIEKFICILVCISDCKYICSCAHM